MLSRVLRNNVSGFSTNSVSSEPFFDPPKVSFRRIGVFSSQRCFCKARGSKGLSSQIYKQIATVDSERFRNLIQPSWPPVGIQGGPERQELSICPCFHTTAPPRISRLNPLEASCVVSDSRSAGFWNSDASCLGRCIVRMDGDMNTRRNGEEPEDGGVHSIGSNGGSCGVGDDCFGNRSACKEAELARKRDGIYEGDEVLHVDGSVETNQNKKRLKLAPQSTDLETNEGCLVVFTAVTCDSPIPSEKSAAPGYAVLCLDQKKCSNYDVIGEKKNEICDAKNESESAAIDRIEFPRISLDSCENVTPARAVDVRKKLLVLDMNGLLVDICPYVPYDCDWDVIIHRKAVYKRPYCDDFLKFCFEKFNVGVWTSRQKWNNDPILDFLLGSDKDKLLFCWDQSHCTNTGFNTIEKRHKPLLLKKLKKLWDKSEPDLPWEKGAYDETNTLLLDDTPYKALLNPPFTAVFPYSYKFTDRADNSLGPGGDLRVYLEGLAAAENVQEYVRRNLFGQKAITERNLSWGYFRKVMEAAGSSTPPRQSEVVEVEDA
ncbi:uncharacterized protein LOC127239307 [Andrographis paniculata]|uniref:uncharacterized protein LOC127239307 n=1 Tax=Andrographis paniculata TaxID=175694 RepID=UPI0021E82522|nr:uncharacterized protein LOC127239307 [Andrographis paniculata]